MSSFVPSHFPADGTALVNTDQRGERSAPPGYVPYQYAVLRFVPRVEREEFCNVGVVVYAQAEAHLELTWHVDDAKARALDSEVDLESLRAQLATLQLIAEGVSGDGRPTLNKLIERFGWITAPRSTTLQPGPVHGGVTDAFPQLQDRLMDALVR